MPLKLLAQLDAGLQSLGDYKRDLAEAPVLLDRAETAVRVFRGIRTQLMEAAPNLHELKGVAAGLRQAGPIAQQHIEIVKQKVKDEQLEPALGKELVGVLSAAVLSLHQAAEARTQELNRLAGKLDGLYAAAKSALSEAMAARATLERAAEQAAEEEDWSGRGTPNGQRPVAQGATEAAGKGNGKGKVVPLKKAPPARATRVKRAKPEAPADA